jgi:predicted PilT family ATPase
MAQQAAPARPIVTSPRRRLRLTAGTKARVTVEGNAPFESGEVHIVPDGQGDPKAKPARFACNALAPAVVTKVYVDEEEYAMEVIVADDQLSLAIGKRGQNVRLAAKLTGWKIDIKSESRMAEAELQQFASFAGTEGEEEPEAEEGEVQFEAGAEAEVEAAEAETEAGVEVEAEAEVEAAAETEASGNEAAAEPELETEKA